MYRPMLWQKHTCGIEIIPPLYEYKIKVTYLDSTPTFYVPYDGSTIVTQAEGNTAINNADHLQIDTMTVGDGMTEIGDGAFDGMSNNKWVTFVGDATLPETITTIGESAFNYWKLYNREGMSIPSGVTSIERSAFSFWEVYNQTTMSIPSSVTSIEWYAFGRWEVYNQPTMSIPSGVTSIGEWAFSFWRAYNQPNMSIPSGVTSIGESAFFNWGAYNQTGMVIPSGVTSIGENAFNTWGVYNQPNMTIPSGVTSIERYAFSSWRAYNQPNMSIPSGVTSIGESAFGSWEAYNQTTMSIPSGVTSIEDYAFMYWISYTQDFVFEHTDTIPTFDQVNGTCWYNWKDNTPAKILTPNSTKTNLEWKTAIGDINYNNGDIESINGVLWDAIADSYFEAGTTEHPFVEADWECISGLLCGSPSFNATNAVFPHNSGYKKLKTYHTTTKMRSIISYSSGSQNEMKGMLLYGDNGNTINIYHRNSLPFHIQYNGTYKSNNGANIAFCAKYDTTLEFNDTTLNVSISGYNSGGGLVATQTFSVDDIDPSVKWALSMSDNKGRDGTNTYSLSYAEGIGYPHSL